MNYINKFLLSLFSFLCFVVSIQSQNKKIDSLKTELSIHTKKDTTRVNLLYSIAFSSFQIDLETTKLYLKKTEDLSNTLNYTKGKAKVAYLSGILESRKSNYTTSLNFFKNSLKHYKSIEDQKGIAAIYNAFGITHFAQSQYDEAINAYKKAYEIFKDLDDKRELITCLANIGNVNIQLGNYNEAILNYDKGLMQSEVVNDEGLIANLHSSLGVVYKYQGNYSLAIKYYIKSLDYKRKTRDTLGIANGLNNLGDAYSSIEKDNTALECLQQSLKYASQMGNKSLVALNNSNIGNIYLHKKEYKKALQYYNESLERSQEIKNTELIISCFHNIGEVNFLLDKPLVARENFIQAKNISKKIGSKRYLSYNLLGIAETYLYEKQYKKALHFTLKGKRIAKELDLLEVQKNAEKLLWNIYRTTNDYKKALISHEQFKILSDSIFNKENIEKITQLEYEYKYKQQLDSASIRELQLTKTVRTVNQNLEKSQRNLLLGVIGFLITALILAGIIFFLRLKNEKSKTQNIAIEQKLLRSQMTPHFIFNSLSVLQGMILNKEEKKSVNYLSKFSKLLRITLENSRNKTVLLSQELTALENYLTLQNLENNAYQYTVLVDNTIDVPSFKVPPMLIQPFVENAIAHAFENQKENRMIDVHLKYLDEQLICTITDNGIGIDAQKETKNQHKKSLSTTITSERLKILSKDFKMKGSITIEDRQRHNEKGTLVTLVIPHKIVIA